MQLNNNHIYLVGGGDFSALPESMFSLNKLVITSNGSARLDKKMNMKFARHGHSVCGFADRYLVVTGSRKEINRAPFRTEIYDTVDDQWLESGQLVTGRHYHSSCSFGREAIYVFCGIA